MEASIDISLNDALYNLAKQINENIDEEHLLTRYREIAQIYNQNEDFIKNRVKHLHRHFFCSGKVFRDEHFVDVKNGSHYDYR